MTENLEDKTKNIQAKKTKNTREEDGYWGSLIVGVGITAVATYIGQGIVSAHDASHLAQGAKTAVDSFSFLGLNAGGAIGLLGGLIFTAAGTDSDGGDGHGSHPDYEL